MTDELRPRKNKPGQGRKPGKPKRQIATRITEKAYANYIAVPSSKRSDWVSEALERLEPSAPLQVLPPNWEKSHSNKPIKTEIATCLTSTEKANPEVKPQQNPSLEEMGPSERAYFEYLQDQNLTQGHDENYNSSKQPLPEKEGNNPDGHSN